MRACTNKSPPTKAPFHDAPNVTLVLQAVTNQIGHRNHFQAVPLTKLDKLRHARHGAIVVHDFADHAGGRETRQARQIDGSFGLAGADQDAAFARAQREYVAGPRQIAGAAIGPDGRQYGAGAVRG